MRSVAIIACFASLLSAGSGLSVAQTEAPTGEPIFWRQNVFSIPFRVNRDQTAADAPAEVQLLMREGPERPWTTAAKARPDLGGFVFRAQQDGQYTFSIRTIDRQNRIHVAPAAATLEVIVDTTPPVLQLQATAGDAGVLQVQINASDQYLNPQSLKLEYQTDSTKPWQLLAVQGLKSNGTQKNATVQLRYLPPGQPDRVTVRGEVFDQAGNRTVSQAAVLLQSGASGGANLYRNVSQSQDPVANDNADQNNFDPTGPGGSQSWRPSRIAQRPLEQQPAADQAGQPAYQSSTPPIEPPGSRPSNPRDAYIQPSGPVEAPLGVLPRVVTSKTFPLRYDVLSSGSSDLSKVELWATRDGGRSWQSFGTDPDRQSPFLVQVDHPGLYGFHIVLQNVAGQGGAPPQNGDSPELWIEVRPPSQPPPPRGRLLDAGPSHSPAPDAQRPGY